MCARRRTARVPRVLAHQSAASRNGSLASDWDVFGEFLAMPRRICFGPFTLDAETRQLTQGSDQHPVHLSPKAYELLAFLIDVRPRAIAKGELHERLWPSTFVSDATLASVVGELRQALGERGRHARFLR